LKSRNILVASSLLLFSSLSFGATPKNSVDVTNSDSTNIISLFKKMNVFFYLGSKSAPFSLRDSSKHNFKFAPTPQTRMGIGFVNKWFGIRLGFVLPTSSENEKLYGKTTSLDFQTNVFAKTFGLDLYFLNYKGFYLENPKDFVPSWNSSSSYPNTRNARRSTYGANFFYIFNHKDFSQKAAFQQIEWQKKSSGSFMIGTYFNVTKVDADSALIDLRAYNVVDNLDLKRIRVTTGGVSIGYSHNFIIWKKLLLNLTGMVGLGYLNTSYTYSTPDKDSGGRNGLGAKVSTRIALGYSREKNYFGIYYITDSYEINLSKKENFQFKVNNIYLFYGRRIDWEKLFAHSTSQAH